MKEMKQMPYKVEEGAIEQAKYRAKMAVREAAHPTERRSHKVQWRWASAVAMAAVVVVGVLLEMLCELCDSCRKNSDLNLRRTCVVFVHFVSGDDSLLCFLDHFFHLIKIYFADRRETK